MRFSTAVAAACLVGSALAIQRPTPVKRANYAITQCSVPNTVALTFDDGPYEHIYDIVNTLDRAGAKATFFWNGSNWGCIYDQVNVDRIKYAYDHGHQVASHTWGHKNLATLSADQLHDEMWRVEEALIKILGVRPAHMRPPFGSYNDLVIQVANQRQQDAVIWDLDTGDSSGKDAAYAKSLIDQRISERPSTILTLAHETYAHSAYDVLPYYIEKLQAAGYRLVTVAECLGGSPYSEYHAPQTRDDSWKC